MLSNLTRVSVLPVRVLDNEGVLSASEGAFYSYEGVFSYTEGTR